MPSAIPFSCIHVAHTDTRAYTRTDQRKLSFFLIPVGEIQAQVFHDDVNERKKYFNNLTHKLCAIVRLICPVDAQLTRTHTGQTAICIFFSSRFVSTFDMTMNVRICRKVSNKEKEMENNCLQSIDFFLQEIASRFVSLFY